MPSSSRKRLVILAIQLVSLLIIGGCAQKPWQEPVLDKQEQQMRGLVSRLLEKQSLCSCCIDAEIAATWDSAVDTGGLNGYLQVFLPSSLKLVAINPLGQPLFALTTDGERFQAINAVKGVFKHGRAASFVRRNSLPTTITHQQWGNWLTGRLGSADTKPAALFHDEASRGIWVEVEMEHSRHFSKEYLLLDTQKELLLERTVFDKKDRETAKIIYSDWTETANCPQPTAIEIQTNEYGTSISITLKEIVTDTVFSGKTFYLKMPPNYLRQYYP